MLIGFCIKEQLAFSPQGGAEMMLLLWYFIDKSFQTFNYFELK